MADPPLWLTALERNSRLREPQYLRQRSRALERLESWFPLAPEGGDSDPVAARAWQLRQRLEAADTSLFEQLRRQIRQGLGASALRRWLTLPAAGGDAYDHLDSLLSGVLALPPPPHVAPPPRDMVFYQPTPARHIVELVECARLQSRDVLIDLGSGLGHVPLLVAILTDADAVGVEREPAYVACAEQAADALALCRARFVAQDAREADLSRGTLFYLYTPFAGAVLRRMLDRLREQAATRPLRIASYGPCTAALARETWLHADGCVAGDRIAMFRADPATVARMQPG